MVDQFVNYMSWNTYLMCNTNFFTNNSHCNAFTIVLLCVISLKLERGFDNPIFNKSFNNNKALIKHFNKAFDLCSCCAFFVREQIGVDNF